MTVSFIYLIILVIHIEINWTNTLKICVFRDISKGNNSTYLFYNQKFAVSFFFFFILVKDLYFHFTTET